MAKRTSPKLHNDKNLLHMLAYHYAACEAAKGVLRGLYLAAGAETDEGREDHCDRAAEDAAELLDYVALRRHIGGSHSEAPAYFVDRAILDRGDFAPFRQHALDVIEMMASAPVTKRRAA